MPDRIAPQIHFDGDWTKGEQRLLEGAIADAETLQAPAARRGRAAGPWLCYCKRLSGMSVYMVHRAGWTQVLHAYEATELGMKILMFGQEAQDGAGGFTA